VLLKPTLASQGSNGSMPIACEDARLRTDCPTAADLGYLSAT
jgi:hypothetical protein